MDVCVIKNLCVAGLWFKGLSVERVYLEEEVLRIVVGRDTRKRVVLYIWAQLVGHTF